MHTSMCNLGYLFPISRLSDQSQQYQVACQCTTLITKPISPVTLVLAGNNKADREADRDGLSPATGDLDSEAEDVPNGGQIVKRVRIRRARIIF